jgi:hypothetical protein
MDLCLGISSSQGPRQSSACRVQDAGGLQVLLSAAECHFLHLNTLGSVRRSRCSPVAVHINVLPAWHARRSSRQLYMLLLTLHCLGCSPALHLVLQAALCNALHLSWHQPAGPPVRCTSPGGSTEGSSSPEPPCTGGTEAAAGNSSRAAARVVEQ